MQNGVLMSRHSRLQSFVKKQEPPGKTVCWSLLAGKSQNCIHFKMWGKPRQKTEYTLHHCQDTENRRLERRVDLELRVATCSEKAQVLGADTAPQKGLFPVWGSCGVFPYLLILPLISKPSSALRSRPAACLPAEVWEGALEPSPSPTPAAAHRL